MAYTNPNTQTAIEAYAAANNKDLDLTYAALDNYTNIHCFEKDAGYEQRWATNCVTKGDKVVLVSRNYGCAKVCTVVDMTKTTVKVNIGHREAVFNRDGVERGQTGSRFALRIVEYVEGLYEIKEAEEKAVKEEQAAWTAKINYISSKAKTLSEFPQRELTSEQMDRLSALFREFEKEHEDVQVVEA